MVTAELTNDQIIDKFLNRINVSFTADSAGWRGTDNDRQSAWKCVFRHAGKQWTVRFHMGSAHTKPPTAYDVLYCVVCDWSIDQNDDYEDLGYEGEELVKVRKDTERQSRRFEDFFDAKSLRVLVDNLENLGASYPPDERVAEARAALLGEDE